MPQALLRPQYCVSTSCMLMAATEQRVGSRGAVLAPQHAHGLRQAGPEALKTDDPVVERPGRDSQLLDASETSSIVFEEVSEVENFPMTPPIRVLVLP